VLSSRSKGVSSLKEFAGKGDVKFYPSVRLSRIVVVKQASGTRKTEINEKARRKESKRFATYAGCSRLSQLYSLSQKPEGSTSAE
jgi:hypothetical protein